MTSRIVLATALGLLVPGLFAQSATHHSSRPTHAPQPVPAAQEELARLLQAQQAALRTGNPATIADATRPLAADLLGDAAQLRGSEGKKDAAITLDRQALALADTPQRHLDLAMLQLQTGHPADALAETQAVLATTPEDVAALRIEGSAERAIGDDAAAVKVFAHALALQPEVPMAYALGSAMLAAHQKAQADAVFKQVLAETDNAAIWHVAIGDAYRQALYFNDAVEQFKQAIAIDPRVGHAEFFLGYTYLQMNQWGPTSESFKHLREAVRLAPHEYVGNFYLGALESTDGSDIASSDRHLRTAEEADPSKPEVWLYLGLNAVRERKPEDAISYLRKAIQLTGTDEAQNNYQIRRVYAVLGRLLIEHGHRAEGDDLLKRYKRVQELALANSASDIASKAGDPMDGSHPGALPAPAVVFPGSSAPISSKPDASASGTATAGLNPRLTPDQVKTEKSLSALLASSLNDLGTAEARMGQFPEALKHFQAAEQWGTPTPALLHNTAVAAFRLGDYRESARALDAFLKVEPEAEHGTPADTRARMMQAMSRFTLGDFAKADEAFASVPTAAMGDPRAAYSWAFSMARDGKQQQANKIADLLSRQDLPASEISLVCHLYVDTENYAQSIPCYEKAYKEYPGLKLAHYQAAESMVHLDRPAEAIAELRQELALDPDNPEVQYAMAYALLQNSQKDQAVALLRQIVATHPEQWDAQYQLGKIALEQGNAPDAVTHLEAAEKADSSGAFVHYQLQAAYRKAGRTADADREAKIYKEMKAAKREIPAERQ